MGYVPAMRAIWLAPLVLWASAPAGTAAPTYEADVLPILEKNCMDCHNSDKMKGGVSVVVADMKPDVGRIVIPGEPGESMLYEVLVRQDIKNKMPPKGGPLDAKEIATIRAWIEGGALFRGDPRTAPAPTPAAAKKPLSGTWTNKAGKAIEADLLRVEDGRAVLRLPNGRVYRFPLSELSDESAARALEFSQQ